MAALQPNGGEATEQSFGTRNMMSMTTVEDLTPTDIEGRIVRIADNSSTERPILWVVSAMEIRNINPTDDPPQEA